MNRRTEYVEIQRNENWIYGAAHHYGTDDKEESRPTPWLKLTDRTHKRVCWFTYPAAKSYLAGVPEQVVKELQDIFDESWIDFVYRFKIISSSEYIGMEDLGKLCLNELKEHIIKISTVTIRNILECLHFGVFEKRHLREIIERVSTKEFWWDVVADEKYAAADTSEFDQVVEALVEEHREKLRDPKLINWVVGQVMKATRGKANPAEIKAKVEDLIHGLPFIEK
ncbi:MAG: hypothetical protein WCY93_07795 [Anaerolineaceae bacterium]